jgi:hypothetical protein
VRFALENLSALNYRQNPINPLIAFDLNLY